MSDVPERINWEKKYKEETGKDAEYSVEAPDNCNCVDYHYYGDYLEWLDEKLNLYHHKLAKAQKWRECLEWHWWQMDLVALMRTEWAYCKLPEEAKQELANSFSLSTQIICTLEKELRESHEKEAVCKK